MDSEVLKSKSLGSLIGTGVGDALGASFEGWRTVEPGAVKMVADRRDILTYTDDTHMMIGVAESLIEKQGFTGEHMAHTFMENYEREPWRGYGPGPPRIFRLIRDGEPWDQAAGKLYHGGSYGNGSAMRIAPVGICYHDNLTRLREVAYKSSQITHSHELGKEGAALQACAVALAVNQEPAAIFDPKAFLASLDEFVHHGVYKEKLEKAGVFLNETDRTRVVAELGNGIEAFNSVPTAIYSFLSHSDSFEEAVLFAVSLGGDTDTIAAMTGAISGAYLGISSIPEKWREKLENRLYIEGLAEKLCDVWLRAYGDGLC